MNNIVKEAVQCTKLFTLSFVMDIIQSGTVHECVYMCVCVSAHCTISYQEYVFVCVCVCISDMNGGGGGGEGGENILL